MDDMSYEEYNRGKNNFVGILVSGLIIIGIAVGFFTTFKQETDKNNNRVIIFSTDYYDKSEVDNAIKYINTQLKTKDKKIILNRN